MKNNRPVNLDLSQIKFPATAIASILHRVSGVIMFVTLGGLLWLLSEATRDESSFQQLQAILTSPLSKFVIWGVLTAIIYHIIAGVRHLIMDAGYWEEMPSGIASAKASFALAAIASVTVGYWIW